MKKETMSVEHFNKIKVKDFGTLVLTQGERESLIIEGDEALLNELISEVRNDTLVLGIEDDWFGRFGKIVSSVLNNKVQTLTYYVTVANLEKISISGKCNLECESLKADSLNVSVSGLGNLKFAHLDCDKLDVKISGRGEFSAAGRAKVQTIRISGSGDYDAPDLASESVRIVISGQGNATLHVEESLDITISGMGQVNYYGRPKLRQVISGLGKSKRLNNQ